MDTIIQHPLDRFSFTPGMAELDAKGKDAIDQLMTMMGDLQFRKDSVWGTYARYVLLVDTSLFPWLCFLAQINCEKLRAHLWGCEQGENGDPESDLRQAELPFTRYTNSNSHF
jgi:hypothetical protein